MITKLFLSRDQHRPRRWQWSRTYFSTANHHPKNTTPLMPSMLQNTMLDGTLSNLLRHCEKSPFPRPGRGENPRERGSLKYVFRIGANRVRANRSKADSTMPCVLDGFSRALERVSVGHLSFGVSGVRLKKLLSPRGCDGGGRARRGRSAARNAPWKSEAMTFCLAGRTRPRRDPLM